MSVSVYLNRLAAQWAGSEEERLVFRLLHDESCTDAMRMGGRELNRVAALTYNEKSCELIFGVISQSLSPVQNTWQTLLKATHLLHTILLYGSEHAVDRCIGLFAELRPLATYNSVATSSWTTITGGGTDYGAPVREAACSILQVLESNDGIRIAREQTREEHGGESLVPLGSEPERLQPQLFTQSAPAFGAGSQKVIGATYGLESIPGMYDNRPERYSDSLWQPIQTGDAQRTREAFAPNLLDLPNDDPAVSSLPDPVNLELLNKQKQMEELLRQQQEQLATLQAQLQLRPPAPQQTYVPSQYTVQGLTLYPYLSGAVSAPQYALPYARPQPSPQMPPGYFPPQPMAQQTSYMPYMGGAVHPRGSPSL